jgi:hypothetical protein
VIWRLPYRNQYESSYDPWPTTALGWAVWIVFFMPGSIALWINYMFPKRGQVWASGRQAQNKIITVMTTLSIYLTLAILAFIMISMRENTR